MLTILCTLIFANTAVYGQTCDPCYAIVDGGDWDDVNSWSDTPGGSATTNIPGNNTDVHVGESGAITINLNVDANADNVTVYTGSELFYTNPDVRLRTQNGSTLTLQSGSSINGDTQTAADLVLRGSLVNNGSVTNLRRIISNSSSAASFSGSGTIDLSTAIEGIGEIRINGVGVITNSISTQIIIERLRLSNDGNTLINSGNIQCNNLRLYGTNGQLTNNGTISVTNNIQSNNNTDSNTITNTGTLTIANNINISDATLTINNSGSLTHSGGFANVGGTETFTNQANGVWTTSATTHANINTFNCSASPNTVIYDLAGAQDVFAPTDGSYYHLTVQNSGTKTAAGSLDINGNLSIAGTAVFDVNTNSADITLAGNWDNSGTGFTQGTRTVTLDGASSAQSIGGTTSTNFYNLVLNNTSGAGPEFSLGINTAADNTLTMTSGNVDLATFTLTLGTAAATPGTLIYTAGELSNGSFTRWYDAVIVADGNVAGLFPMADANGNTRPFYVTPATAPATGGTVTVSITTSDQANNIGPIDDNGTDIVRQHQASWNVSTGGGLAGGNDYNLRGSGTSFGTIDAVSDLRLMTSAGVVGTDGGAGGTTSNPSIDRTGLTLAELANSFHVSSINGTDSPLPIELLSFNAKSESEYVLVEWSTATEIDNDFFSIERSSNGVDYYEIGRADGAGHSTKNLRYSYIDYQPLMGKSFYRLRQTDFDGKTEIFSPVTIEANRKIEISLYPNPLTTNQFTIASNHHVDSPLQVGLFDQSGRNIPFQSTPNGSLLEISPIEDLQSGIYIVSIQYGDTVLNRRLLVK